MKLNLDGMMSWSLGRSGLAFVSLLAISCSDGEDAAHSRFDGSYLSRGQGLMLELHGGSGRLYELTAQSCIANGHVTVRGDQLTVEYDEDDEQEPFSLMYKIARDSNVLALHNFDPELDRTFVAASKPALCAHGGTGNSGDPELNFELFWRTFSEQYAFFGKRGVDWDQTYAALRPQVNAHTSDQELYEIMTRALDPLRDYHLTVETPEQSYAALFDPELEESLEQLEPYFAGLAQQHQLTAIRDGLMAYGKLADDVGYLQINAMQGFSDERGPLLVEQETEQAALAIDTALATLSAVPTLIVDIRINGGGVGSVAMAIAGRFADQRRLAFRKQVRTTDGFTPLQDFFVEPLGAKPYVGKVLLLTSGATASAAEVFTMAMRVLPNVKIVGERGAGVHSVILSHRLPNGWYFTVSNEQRIAADGKLYEAEGIPPDVVVPFRPSRLGQGQDDILAAALRLARGEQP